MDRLERLFKLDQILKNCRYPITAEKLMTRLECSQATLTRDVFFYRDMLGAPLETVRDQGYQLDPEQRFELPGLWFSADELRALLTVHALLRELGEGFLDEAIRPLEKQVAQLLQRAANHSSPEQITQRIHFQPVFQRGAVSRDIFTSVAGATLKCIKIQICYHGRASDLAQDRTVSPHRLTYYRNNWYLDAWCHRREGMRRFSIDRITHTRCANESARPCSQQDIAQLDNGFGIFLGAQVEYAELRFTAERARWVAGETWHSDQQCRYEPDGSYYLKIPYADSRELIGDILRHGSHVEVLAPAALREQVIEEISFMAAKYSGYEENYRYDAINPDDAVS